MLDLNRDLKKTMAEFCLMVTLTAVLGACSHSAMSPDQMEEVANIEVEQTQDNATAQTLGEAGEEQSHAVTGEVAATQSPKRIAKKFKRSRKVYVKKHKSSKLKQAKASLPSSKDSELEKELSRLQAASSATITPTDTPPSPPDLQVPSAITPIDGSSQNWMYVVCLGVLFGVLTLGWRLKRRGSPRRLILN